VPEPAQLAEIEAACKDCTRCPLAASRTQVVFGRGDPGADLVFVGEAPGADEDAQGHPFVGRSGKLLDRLVLEEIGLERDEFFVMNTLMCLRYNAKVQLGDGSWERISRLVNHKYSGDVMSVDAYGRLVPRRVVGWHATPLAGRRVFKLSFGRAKPSGRFVANVELTGDHPVLTDEGWVAVQDLRPGARIATGQGVSATALDMLEGTLLGDAHLPTKSACLTMAHSFVSLEYVQFKASVLAELEPTVATVNVAVVAGDERRHDVIHLRTRASRALRMLRSDWYAPRKRVPGHLAERLNARILAVWFMDDGHLRMRPPRRPSAEIATCAFSDEDIHILLAGLGGLGLNATTRRNRIYFDVLNTPMLSRLIAPYVPPPMRYKLVPEIAESVPYNSDLWRPMDRWVMFDEVVVEEITHQPRTDTTFFCIDVEDTHNFVTAGGVVHNCRPPNNRDPLPEELDACRPWFDAKLAALKPKVIVTLGNFASKALLGTTTGITKLRGTTYEWRDGVKLVPTFHPAAVLRGNADAMASMRADLVRAKQALRS
jgi:uracil-DNA glycosylase